MDNRKIVNVFIGSPSDTTAERNQIDSIIEELNQTLGNTAKIYIRSVMWEKDVHPTVGTDSQDVINSQTRNYDIFVGIMWKKFGNPTPRGNSPTEEEYTYALNSFKNGGHCKDIIFMFSKIPFDIDEANGIEIENVKEFRKRVASNGVLYKTYNSLNDFTSQLRIALYKSIQNLTTNEGLKTKITTKPVKKITPLNHIDEHTKLVFDTLAISPAINSVKTKFIESYILLFLFDKNQATAAEIIEYLCQKLTVANENLYNTVLSRLNQTDRLVKAIEGKNKYFSISEKTRCEIADLKEKAEKSINCAINDCQAICKKYDLGIDVNEVHIYISNLFATNYSIDNGKFVNGTINRENNLKQIYESLVNYIQSDAGIPASYVEPIANEFVSVYSKNQCFYKSNISKMFLNLFQSEKLEEYLATTKRELILDTQVLLQICCVSFDDFPPAHADLLYKVGVRFWDSVKSNPMIQLYTTSGYVQEVASHMKQAVNLSRFLSLDYIAELGNSKNIFFNHYMMIKDDMQYTCFEDYVSEMLALDPADIESTNFDNTVCRIFGERFEDLSITILRHQDVNDYAVYKKEYETELSYTSLSRSFDARNNDINAAIIAGNYFNDFADTTYLVTYDSLFAKVRDRFIDKFQSSIAYWNVFNPQKISEMLSLINFKVDPLLVDENIISLTESYFNTSNDTISFIDLLNSIIDQKELKDWKLATKLSKLRKLCRENFEGDKLSTTNLPIDEILSEIINTMTSAKGTPMADLKAIFCNNHYADRISELINIELNNHKKGATSVNEDTYKKLSQMINENNNHDYMPPKQLPKK